VPSHAVVSLPNLNAPIGRSNVNGAIIGDSKVKYIGASGYIRAYILTKSSKRDREKEDPARSLASLRWVCEKPEIPKRRKLGREN
jgi:hypothetical protein